MAKNDNKGVRVDEAMLREMMGGSCNETDTHAEDQAPSPHAESKEELPGESRRRRTLLPDYASVFLKKNVLKESTTVCISRQTRRNISAVLRLRGDKELTVSGYVETVMIRHFEMYRDEINRLLREQSTAEIR